MGKDQITHLSTNAAPLPGELADVLGHLSGLEALAAVEALDTVRAAHHRESLLASLRAIMDRLSGVAIDITTGGAWPRAARGCRGAHMAPPHRGACAHVSDRPILGDR